MYSLRALLDAPDLLRHHVHQALEKLQALLSSAAFSPGAEGQPGGLEGQLSTPFNDLSIAPPDASTSPAPPRADSANSESAPAPASASATQTAEYRPIVMGPPTPPATGLGAEPTRASPPFPLNASQWPEQNVSEQTGLHRRASSLDGAQCDEPRQSMRRASSCAQVANGASLAGAGCVRPFVSLGRGDALSLCEPGPELLQSAGCNEGHEGDDSPGAAERSVSNGTPTEPGLREDTGPSDVLSNMPVEQASHGAEPECADGPLENAPCEPPSRPLSSEQHPPELLAAPSNEPLA